MSRYKYKLIPLKFLVAFEFCSQGIKPDSYMADDAEAQALSRVFKDGYRWVRTIHDYAVFEKEIVDGDALQSVASMVREFHDLFVPIRENRAALLEEEFEELIQAL